MNKSRFLKTLLCTSAFTFATSAYGASTFIATDLEAKTNDSNTWNPPILPRDNDTLSFMNDPESKILLQSQEINGAPGSMFNIANLYDIAGTIVVNDILQDYSILSSNVNFTSIEFKAPGNLTIHPVTDGEWGNISFHSQGGILNARGKLRGTINGPGVLRIADNTEILGLVGYSDPIHKLYIDLGTLYLKCSCKTLNGASFANKTIMSIERNSTFTGNIDFGGNDASVISYGGNVHGNITSSLQFGENRAKIILQNYLNIVGDFNSTNPVDVIFEGDHTLNITGDNVGINMASTSSQGNGTFNLYSENPSITFSGAVANSEMPIESFTWHTESLVIPSNTQIYASTISSAENSTVNINDGVQLTLSGTISKVTNINIGHLSKLILNNAVNNANLTPNAGTAWVVFNGTVTQNGQIGNEQQNMRRIDVSDQAILDLNNNMKVSSLRITGRVNAPTATINVTNLFFESENATLVVTNFSQISSMNVNHPFDEQFNNYLYHGILSVARGEVGSLGDENTVLKQIELGHLSDSTLNGRLRADKFRFLGNVTINDNASLSDEIRKPLVILEGSRLTLNADHKMYGGLAICPGKTIDLQNHKLEIIDKNEDTNISFRANYSLIDVNQDHPTLIVHSQINDNSVGQIISDNTEISKVHLVLNLDVQKTIRSNESILLFANPDGEPLTTSIVIKEESKYRPILYLDDGYLRVANGSSPESFISISTPVSTSDKINDLANEISNSDVLVNDSAIIFLNSYQNQTGDAKDFAETIANMNTNQSIEALEDMSGTGTEEAQMGLTNETAQDIVDIVTTASTADLKPTIGSSNYVYLGEQLAVSSGSEVFSPKKGLWLQFVGSKTKQKKHKSAPGYKSSSTGAVLGYDSLINDRTRLGISFGMVESKLKMKDFRLGDSSTVRNYVTSVYGNHEFTENFFIKALGGFSYSNIHTNELRRRLGDIIQIAKINYDSKGYILDGGFGYRKSFNNGIVLIPELGLRSNFFSDKAYKEFGTRYNKIVDSKKGSNHLANIAISASKEFQSKDMQFIPNFKFMIEHLYSGKSPTITSRLNGQYQPFISKTQSLNKTFYHYGSEFVVRSGMMEYETSIENTRAKKYNALTGSFKVRINM